MDSVLLTVLKNWPEHGPNMFLRMGKSLTGDQFVRFLSGQSQLVDTSKSCSFNAQDTFSKSNNETSFLAVKNPLMRWWHNGT